MGKMAFTFLPSCILTFIGNGADAEGQRSATGGYWSAVSLDIYR
jgi:hypothetical protein